MNMSEILSLQSERRVIALHQAIQDATFAGVFRNLLHSRPQIKVRVVEARQNGSGIGGATRNVVRWIIRVDDGKAVAILVGEATNFILRGVRTMAQSETRDIPC